MHAYVISRDRYCISFQHVAMVDRLTVFNRNSRNSCLKSRDREIEIITIHWFTTSFLSAQFRRKSYPIVRKMRIQRASFIVWFSNRVMIYATNWDISDNFVPSAAGSWASERFEYALFASDMDINHLRVLCKRPFKLIVPAGRSYSWIDTPIRSACFEY